jgi:AcrR family transcriptional regulator
LVAVQRSAKGRRPGNQDTRGEILTAARHAFAAKGFAGASIRGIAADAGVDAALVHHYFETKEQLFLATVDIPIALTDLLDHVTASGLDGLGDRLIRTILGVWDSDLQPSLVAAIRTALTDPGLTRSISEFLTLEVISRILKTLDLPEAEASRRAGLVASQVLGVIMGRYVLKLPPLVAQSSDDVARAIGPTLQHYLSDDLPSRQPKDLRVAGVAGRDSNGSS